MGTISHKQVADTLTEGLKLAAIRTRKTVRQYTLDALSDAVARDLDPGKIQTGHTPTYGNPDRSMWPLEGQKKDVARAVAPVVPASELPPPAHDPATCRLRGCGRCAALGVTRE